MMQLAKGTLQRGIGQHTIQSFTKRTGESVVHWVKCFFVIYIHSFQQVNRRSS